MQESSSGRSMDTACSQAMIVIGVGKVSLLPWILPFRCTHCSKMVNKNRKKIGGEKKKQRALGVGRWANDWSPHHQSYSVKLNLLVLLPLTGQVRPTNNRQIITLSFTGSVRSLTESYFQSIAACCNRHHRCFLGVPALHSLASVRTYPYIHPRHYYIEGCCTYHHSFPPLPPPSSSHPIRFPFSQNQQRAGTIFLLCPNIVQKGLQNI